jgi:hypothetical protein
VKNLVANPSWGYSNGVITFSATVQIATDDYDADTGTGQILWADTISDHREVNDSSDWYPLMKADLLRKAQEIIQLFVTNMTTVLTKTQKASVEEIISDVIQFVREGIN